MRIGNCGHLLLPEFLRNRWIQSTDIHKIWTGSSRQMVTLQNQDRFRRHLDFPSTSRISTMRHPLGKRFAIAAHLSGLHLRLSGSGVVFADEANNATQKSLRHGNVPREGCWLFNNVLEDERVCAFIVPSSRSTGIGIQILSAAIFKLPR